MRNDLPSIPAPLSLASQSLPEFAGLTDLTKPTMAFFTICSRNFLAFARTLYDSLSKHHPESQFYVALCDAPEPPFTPEAEPFPFIYLDDIDLPQWREMSHRYNITEFNTAIKPFVIAHLMRKGVADCIVYLDPDIIVTSHMQELEDAFADGASVILTPHVTIPAENVEVSDIKMLQYGIYNLGFIGFRCGPETLKVVQWWGRQLIDHCVIKLEQGLFVDQKWADLLPAFLGRSYVLRHPGYNVAYWNMAQRNVVRSGDGWLVNGEPLRFAHFSGCKLDDSKVYSRHSGQFDASNIGDLKLLLDEYRNRVLANGHHRYRAIPYAFSWNGSAGINQHTPQPEGGDDGASAPAGQGTEVGSLVAATAPMVSVVGQDKVARDTGMHPQPAAVDILRTSTLSEDGFFPLAKKAGRVFAREVVSGVRTRIKYLRQVSSAQHSIAPVVHAERRAELMRSLQEDGAMQGTPDGQCPAKALVGYLARRAGVMQAAIHRLVDAAARSRRRIANGLSPNADPDEPRLCRHVRSVRSQLPRSLYRGFALDRRALPAPRGYRQREDSLGAGGSGLCLRLPVPGANRHALLRGHPPARSPCQDHP